MAETLQQEATANDLVLSRYRPLRPLGSGGSGSVWLARDERASVDVALKIVAREGNAGSRAEREALAAARLRHDRCLRAFTLARDDRHVYIAYEYVPGRTLRHALREGELDDAATVEAAAQVLEGLAHAHGHGIVHRDVKPANVLLADGDEVSVRLLDFGLAQLAEGETLTAAGDVPGTLAYISPERLRDEPATAAADVWSVGVLLWEGLAGSHPFWSGSVLETARRIEAGAPSLREARPDLPKRLIAAVDRMLSLDPRRRPSAAKLAPALRLALRDERRRRARPTPLRRDVRQAAPAALAALVAGWSAASLPFYPHGWAPALALLAAVATLLRPRAGLALALAVPVFPLGNLSLGAALVYAGLAAVWIGVSWRDARLGLFFAVGPLLGAANALGLFPLAAQLIRSPARRFAHVLLGVACAGLVAGVRGTPLPFTGADPPQTLGIARSEEPAAVLAALRDALGDHPALGIEALVLALGACLLPLAAHRGAWGVAVFGCAMLAATLLPAPGVAAIPVVAAVWVMCVVLGVALRLGYLPAQPAGDDTLARASARASALVRRARLLASRLRLPPLAAAWHEGTRGRR